MSDGERPPIPDAELASRLAARLAGLDVRIEEAHVEVAAVDVPSYPGGPRPSATVTLAGGGRIGRGESVAWTEEAQRRFADEAPRAVPRATLGIGELRARLAARLAEPYGRAAVEAAAIDLALRQARTSLAGLAGARARAVRYVVSLGATPDPLAAVQEEIDRRGDAEVKIDVDAAWSDSAIAALARLGCVRILDWKGSGTSAAHERLRAVLPGALHEDPARDPRHGAAAWPPSLRGRVSLDQAIDRAGAVDRLAGDAAAINVKPARMGGVLEAIEAIVAAGRRGLGVYLGGMFEIGVGRMQLLAIAAVLCPDAPNDIAPIARAGFPTSRPARLTAADGPGLA